MNKYSTQKFIADYKMVLHHELHYANLVPKWVYLILVIPEVWFWVHMVRRWKRRH